ncbi:transposase, partial [Leyella stercorea]|uniref:transposase n=2 Tax=Prevotellaceae TaxID=171552 RepID=UPI001F1B3C50
MLRLNSLNTIHSGSIQRDSYDEEQDGEFAFLTNAFHLTAPEIANLYKNRWQIE